MSRNEPGPSSPAAGPIENKTEHARHSRRSSVSSRSGRKSPRFDGHRRKSWCLHSLCWLTGKPELTVVNRIVEDYDELTELRARQRTYEGAYVRAAFANLIYALIILKLFSEDFAKIGLLWVILAGILLSISLYRRGRDYLDFSDSYIAETGRQLALGFYPSQTQSGGGLRRRLSAASSNNNNEGRRALPPAGKRLWSTRPFKTSGRAVLGLAAVVLAAEVTLFVLILRLPPDSG